jgi:two-component system sensor histidine kinase CpxA
MKRLPYPALYIRMALYIGAALTAFVLIGALAFASIATWELAGYLETRNSEIGREAAGVVKTEGRAGLERWLGNEATVPQDASVYILDASGLDILGRPVPDIYKEFVASSVVGSHEAEDNFRPVRLTSEIVTPDGEVLSIFIVPSNITLLGSLTTGLALLAVALLVIASVAWLIAGRIGKPIGELQRAVRNLAAGDIDTRVPESIAKRPDELGQLAGDFNAMAEHLNQLIKGREQLMRELSHELRSPLTRLQAALALAAARNQLGKDEQCRIENEIAQMNKVIGEILRYSALDSSVSMTIRLVRIDRLLRRLVEVEEIEARSAGCSIELDSERNLEVAGDPELLNSALENILRNAIRYAPAGSVVSLQALRDGGDICVTIRDRGPGVDEDQLERIFEPYVRNGGDSGGTGLGLAIVQRVIERHGGSVYAECAAEGGLTMTARIPAADFS